MLSANRILLFIFSIIGTFLFTAAFITSLVNPGYVEEMAKDIIRHEVEERVHEKIDVLEERFLSSKAGVLLKKHSEEAEEAKRQLKEKAPGRIGAVIAEMRNLDCECRKKIENHFHQEFESLITKASQAQERLTPLIRSKYMEISTKLTREFRIFTGINALAFAFLGFAAFFKRSAGLHLTPPALVLVAAAVFTGYLYLFNQNWLRTILFSDYVGFAYIFYLSVVFAFLCDISFNRARFTARLLNSIGTDIQVLPC